MNISIVGLNMVDLLLNLYNKANCQGTVFDSNPSMKIAGRLNAMLSGERDKAQAIINQGRMHFDYEDLGAGPRPLKFFIANNEIDPARYDEYNGAGQMAAVIVSMQHAVGNKEAAIKVAGMNLKDLLQQYDAQQEAAASSKSKAKPEI